VMQSTHVRESDDRTLLKRLHRTGVRALHGQRQVRTPVMVIKNISIIHPETLWDLLDIS